MIPAASPAIAIVTSAHRMTRSNDIGPIPCSSRSWLVAEKASSAIEGNQLARRPAAIATAIRLAGSGYVAATTVVIASAGRLASSACSVLMVE